ncbi:MAG: substrate-binding domain-containing protein [Chloroflexi bacterium]|nr:substrate-binding domain-containing protein [Chloroflexota bacterium]MBU1747529.1 substrate-binding domain-containing protein [Chloroflexota bacterium]
MKKQVVFAIVGVLVVISMLAAQCPSGPASPTEVPQPTTAPQPTKAAEPTKAVEPTTVPEGPPLKIGLLRPVSAGLVIYGEMEERGFQLGLDYATNGTGMVAGRKIEVIIKDTEGKPDVGVSRARELVEKDGCEILVGSCSSAVTLAMMEVAKENKTILMVPVAAADQISGEMFNEYTFRTSSSAAQDALAGAKYAARSLGKKFVGLAPDYSWGQDQIKVWKEIVEQEGGEFVAEVYAPADTTEFTPYFQKCLDSGAEVLFVAWAGAGGVQLFNQLQEQKITEKLQLTTGIVDNATFAALGTALVGNKGMIKYYYEFPKTKENDWLVKEHMARYQVPPDLFTDVSFASAQALVMALEKTSGSTKAEDLIKVLEGMSWPAPKGTFTIRAADHACLQPMYTATVVMEGDKPVIKLVAEMSAEDCAPKITAPAR